MQLEDYKTLHVEIYEVWPQAFKRRAPEVITSLMCRFHSGSNTKGQDEDTMCEEVCEEKLNFLLLFYIIRCKYQKHDTNVADTTKLSLVLFAVKQKGESLSQQETS